MRKKVLFCLCLIVIAMFLVLSVSAEEIVDEIDISMSSREPVVARVYKIGEDEFSIVISGYGSIANDAARRLDAYKGQTVSVTVEDGVKNIPGSMFASYVKLRTVSLGMVVYKIGSGAFRGCAELESINIPESVVQLENDVFNGCYSLREINVPNGVTYIGSSAFANCKSLTSIYIPETVSTVRNGAFTGCSNLTIYTPLYEVPSSWESNWNPSKCPVSFGYGNTEHVHDYEKTVTIEPTHYYGGEALYICKECGDNYTETIDRLEHNHVLTSQKDATHFEKGEKVYTCSCGDIRKETIEIIEHSYTDEITVEATHLAAGVKTYTCSCGDSYTEVIPAIAEHTYVDGVCACGHVELVDPVKEWLLTSNNTAQMKAYLYNDKGNDGYRLEIVLEGTGKMAMPGNAYTLWADYKEKITTIVVEYGVSIISNYAFKDFTHLKSVNLVEGLNGIQGYVFENCSSLTEISLPDSVNGIGAGVFRSCTSLIAVKMPAGLQSVSASLFINCCSLKSVVMPAGVTTIPVDTFQNCYALESVVMEGDVREIGMNAFLGCKALEEVILPSTVTKISMNAFRNCSSLKKVSIPLGVTTVGDYAFSGCPELEIYYEGSEIPEGWAQNWNSGNNPVEFGNVHIHSYKGALESEATHCQNGVIRYSCSCGDSYTVLTEKTPEHTTFTVTTVKAPTHTEFGTDRYTCECGYSYTTATEKVPHSFENGVCECGATWNGALVEMWNISRRVTDDVGAFLYEDEVNPGYYRLVISGYGEIWWQGLPWSKYRNTITSVEIDVQWDRTYDLPTGIFSNFTALKDVKISEGLRTVAFNAFRGCRSLEYVELPGSVLSIENTAFLDCVSLKGIYGLKNVDKVGNDAFRNCYLIEKIDGLETVCYYGKGVFANCKSLRSIVLGVQIKELLPSLFENCSSLETVVILGDISCVPDKAFFRCANLKFVIINYLEPLAFIGTSAFEGCTNLNFVTFAGGVDRIKAYAFTNCRTLIGIDLGNKLSAIETNAFAGCTTLAQIKLPASLREMGNSVFRDCRALKIYVEPGFEVGLLSQIGSSAIFEYCYHNHFDHENYYSCGHEHKEDYWGGFFISEADHYTVGIAVDVCGCGAARAVITDKLAVHESSYTAVNGLTHRTTCPCGLDMVEEHQFKDGECTACGYVRNLLTRDEIDPFGFSVRDDGFVNGEKFGKLDKEILYDGITSGEEYVDINCASGITIAQGFLVPGTEIKRIAIYTRAKIFGEISYQVEYDQIFDENGEITLIPRLYITIEYSEIDPYFYDTPQPIYLDNEIGADFISIGFTNLRAEETQDLPLEIYEIQFICNEKYVDVSKNEEGNEIVFKPVNNTTEKGDYVEMIIGAEAMEGLSEADTVRIETIFGSIALDELARHKISAEDGIKVSVEKTGVDPSGKVTYSISICDKDGNPLMPSTSVDENGEFIVELQFKKGKNKDDIKIRYKGTDGNGKVVYEYKDILDYDPVTGKVTFKTKHFSDYEIYDVNENMSMLVDDLIEFKGYAKSEFTNAICVGYGINYDVCAEYEAITGQTLDFGVLFASEELLGGKLPLDENGNAVILEQGMVAQMSLKGYSYLNYDFVLSDLTEDLYDHSFVISGYAVTSSGVVYYQDNGISTEVIGITYKVAVLGETEE